MLKTSLMKRRCGVAINELHTTGICVRLKNWFCVLAVNKLQMRAKDLTRHDIALKTDLQVGASSLRATDVC